MRHLARRFGRALARRRHHIGNLGAIGALGGAVTGYFATHPHHDGLTVMQSRAFGGAEGAVVGGTLGMMLGMIADSSEGGV